MLSYYCRSTIYFCGRLTTNKLIEPALPEVLDELPQFWDVLKGNISVVGPRPALPNEVDKYTDYQRQRLLVKPGITCYWQTRRDRDSITFDEWVDLDLLYIHNCGPWSDFKLIIQTIGVVLTAQGN